MIERRTLIKAGASSSLLSLVGCRQLPSIFSPSPQGAVDIHTHIFNGRDLPVTGFLRQVVLRSPDGPIERKYLTESFLKLVSLILLSGTPSPERELRQLNEGTAIRTSDILDEDEHNVSKGIAEFQRQSGSANVGFRTDASDDQIVLEQIESELRLNLSFSATRNEADYSALLAREIYREGAGDRLASGRFRWSESGVLQTVRWAGMLTRARSDIFNELKRLYGGVGQIKIFSPSLVDLQSWMLPRDDVSDIRAQIDVTSKIAQLNKQDLILSFAPFCPLRAALEAEDSSDPNFNTLRHVQYAMTIGFAGVKVYPPMGFVPFGNADLPEPQVRRWPKGGGAALDAQLAKFYDWCVAEDVPIKAHANNSLAAQNCSGIYASPRNWEAVLSQRKYRQLRLNLAHFGGFDETRPPKERCPDPFGTDWEDVIVDMIERFPNLYFDLGYWTEVLDTQSPEAAEVIDRMRTLISRSSLVAERMMYGSDWSMLGREPTHNYYTKSVKNALVQILPDAAQRDAVLGSNALRYLNIRRWTKQWYRLSPFFADNAVFRDLF